MRVGTAKRSWADLKDESPDESADPATVDCFRLVVQGSTDAKQVTSPRDAACILAFARVLHLRSEGPSARLTQV